jgi:hypothetical protein
LIAGLRPRDAFREWILVVGFNRKGIALPSSFVLGLEDSELSTRGPLPIGEIPHSLCVEPKRRLGIG